MDEEASQRREVERALGPESFHERSERADERTERTCRSIGEREPDLTVHGLRLAFERQQATGSAPGRR